MTQEDKDLLLKDLCGRLSYGVKVLCLRDFNRDWYNLKMIDIEDNEVYLTADEPYTNRYSEIETVRPYLFPISSMSDVIKDEIYQETGLYDIFEDEQIHIEVGTNFVDVCKLFNILNKYHIDYNGLIPKGHANDATNLNIY